MKLNASVARSAAISALATANAATNAQRRAAVIRARVTAWAALLHAVAARRQPHRKWLNAEPTASVGPTASVDPIASAQWAAKAMRPAVLNAERNATVAQTVSAQLAANV